MERADSESRRRESWAIRFSRLLKRSTSSDCVLSSSGDGFSDRLLLEVYCERVWKCDSV